MESINGYVYFIATEDFSFFKIGFSEDPPKRLQRAQVDCPLKLILYKQIPGSRRLEQKIQYHLGSH